MYMWCVWHAKKKKKTLQCELCLYMVFSDWQIALCSVKWFTIDIYRILIFIMTGTAIDQDENISLRLSKEKNLVSTSSNNHQASLSPLLQGLAQNITPDKDLQVLNSSSLFLILINSKNLVEEGSFPPSCILTIGCRDVNLISIYFNPKTDTTNNLSFVWKNQSGKSKSSGELHLEEEDLDVPWNELVLKEKIGAGIFLFILWRTSQVHVLLTIYTPKFLSCM